MGHKVKQSLMSSRIDFFYYAFRNVLLVSIPLLVVSGVVLSHLSFHYQLLSTLLSLIVSNFQVKVYKKIAQLNAIYILHQ